MATLTTTTRPAAALVYSSAMAPIAARFDAAMAEAEGRLAALRQLPEDQRDEVVERTVSDLDGLAAEVAALPVETAADATIALRALAWISGAENPSEIGAMLGNDSAGTEARLLDALLARAIAA